MRRSGKILVVKNVPSVISGEVALIDSSLNIDLPVPYIHGTDIMGNAKYLAVGDEKIAVATVSTIFLISGSVPLIERA